MRLVFDVKCPKFKGYSKEVDVFYKCSFYTYSAKLIGLDILLL